MTSGRVVCVTGPESTGKTTLATELAAALGAPLVAEVSRRYLAGRTGYGPEDVLAIAREQQAAEQRALAADAPLVVADTDLNVIQVWWEEKYGALPPWLRERLAERSPRLYLLAYPDLRWEPDPLRESPHDRVRLYRRYRELLRADGFPWTEVYGFGAARPARALARVRAWMHAEHAADDRG